MDDAPYHEEETDRQLGKPYGTSRREWYRDDRLHDEHGRNGRQKEELMDNVVLGGVATYLERAEDANVNLFI